MVHNLSNTLRYTWSMDIPKKKKTDLSSGKQQKKKVNPNFDWLKAPT